MAGIVGIEGGGKKEQVQQMLERIAHRGESGAKILESHDTTLGAVWSDIEIEPTPPGLQQRAAWDGSPPPSPDPSALEQKRGPFALTAATRDGVFLARDRLGIRPLYYGRTDDGALCFASEAKALLAVTNDVQEFPPGTWFDSQKGFQSFFAVERGTYLNQDPERVATQLRLRLEKAVARSTDRDLIGCWLSGNLNSATLAALARPHVEELHTFAVGTPGTPDLERAQRVATSLQTEHHEITVTLDEVLGLLPAVIWHLESFDVPLVRSSVTRYLAAQRAADYVTTMLFDDGADELFGGCAYLKKFEPEGIADEVVKVAQRLHNTALQRADRSATSHGLIPHLPFLDLDVFQYALSIPADLKVRRNGQIIDKWILRQAMKGALPDDMLSPAEATLWQGAGVGFLLALSAENQITDGEFCRERVLPNGWTLEDKEALMYCRIFKEHFGDLDDLSWMGRTKGAPKP